MNEQAFPNEGFNGWGEPQKGMTLRDYFAAKVMQAFESRKDLDDVPLMDIANRSYRIADVMLKARDNGNS